MTFKNPTDLEIKKLLQDVRVFAIVGASPKIDRPSYSVMSFLLSKGYRVVPINPTLSQSEILGQKVYSCLGEVSPPVDVADYFRSSSAVLQDVQVALQAKERLRLKCLWMQKGVINEEAAEIAQEAGLQVIMDRCPKIEYLRLLEES